MLDDPLTQRDVALGNAVLERGRGIFRQHLVAGVAELRHREQLRRGAAGAEGDDARHLCVMEHLADSAALEACHACGVSVAPVESGGHAAIIRCRRYARRAAASYEGAA